MARSLGRTPRRLRGLAFAAWAIIASGLLVAGGLVSFVPASSALAVDVSASETAASTVDASIVKAADLSQFKAGNIISDAVFFNSATMTEAQIQSFLESKVSSCRSGYTCLKDYYVQTRAIAADAMCGAYPGGGSERASRVIFKVAQACGINPQVILVMLQKEQGLITSTAPSSWAYQAAMGQGCPDTAACDARYYGLFNQVYGGAWQLKRYANPPGTSNYFTWYAPGKTWNVLYHPNSACGRGAVYIENQATANLYYYTPYQPNAAALAAGYGLGDGCSSYGNRNFFNYFTDWFGSTQSSGRPDLTVSRIEAVASGVRLAGRSVVPGHAQAVKIQVFVNNVWRTTLATDAAGSFDTSLPVEIGSRRICLVSENIVTGATSRSVCRWLTVLPDSVFGKLLDVEAEELAAEVAGWAIDPAAATPAKIHIMLDNVWNRTVIANQLSPTVEAEFPGVGQRRGFVARLSLAPGNRKICVIAESAADGSLSELGCSWVNVPGVPPSGSVSLIAAVPEAVEVAGVAEAPSGHVKIQVFVGNVWRQTLAVVNGGFSGLVPVDVGSRRVCLVAEDSKNGATAQLGCRWVTVMPGTIFGELETATGGPGSLHVSGWAIDPSGEANLKLHVLVNNSWHRTEYARVVREDVASIFPGAASTPGFEFSVSATVGGHNATKVCIVAESSQSGQTTNLGCSWVTPLTGDPYGWVNQVSAHEGGIFAYGWAIDPDYAGTVKVHVLVDNVWRQTVFADQWRTDLGNRYPLYGPRHAFSQTVAVTSGRHKVCFIAENMGFGENRQLGCSWLDVPAA